jgi:GNAT superfamily N-acetyltransferase
MPLNRGKRRLALAQVLKMPLPLSAQAGLLLDEYGRGGRRYTVYCGHREGSSPDATVRLLRRKLRAARASDERSYEAAAIGGRSLSVRDVAWSTLTLQDDRDDEESARAGACFGYQLVVYAGRSPVGFCTFALKVEDASPGGVPLIELDVDEVWVMPAHRGIGVGAAFARTVARLVTEGLVELESRLGEFDAVVEFELRVGAEVHSASGAAFLRAAADSLQEQADELAVLFAGGLQRVLFDEIALEMR